MCTSCFQKGDLQRRFKQFHDQSYKCDTCAITRNEQCLPRAIVHGQKPKRVFFGPRLAGVGSFKVFGIEPTEAFSSAQIDGLLGGYDGFLARHTWMPELATALAGGTVQEIVYLGQTGGPAAERLSDPDTAKNPMLADWYREHTPVIKLAEQLYGPATSREDLRAKLERAIPVHAQRQLECYAGAHAPGVSVHAALFDAATGKLEWVSNPLDGSYNETGNIRLQARYEHRKAALADDAHDSHPDYTHDNGRAYVGCMDSRAIPSHVFKVKAHEVFVSSSMGGIWAPYNSRLARLTWMADLAIELDRAQLNEIVFLGHTGCAGANLLASPPVDNPLRADWQRYYQNMLMPVVNGMSGNTAGDPLQSRIEMAIPVYMKDQISKFLAAHYPERNVEVDSYLYQMREGNLYRLCGAENRYEQLTFNQPRDFDNLPEVCPVTKVAFSCK